MPTDRRPFRHRHHQTPGRPAGRRPPRSRSTMGGVRSPTPRCHSSTATAWDRDGHDPAQYQTLSAQGGASMATMMARVQVKYGQAETFFEIMSHLVPVLERNGWKLVAAFQTQIGRLWEVWD